VTQWHNVWLLVMALMLGCSTNPIGTEAAARSFFQAEFQKWIAGESSAVATKRSQRLLLAPPISYDIRSVARSEPDVLACQDTAKLPTDWNTWPAFKLNVAIEWKSDDGSPMTNVTRYWLTWNVAEQRWYVTEDI
jgi:hypothetical protein